MCDLKFTPLTWKLLPNFVNDQDSFDFYSTSFHSYIIRAYISPVKSLGSQDGFLVYLWVMLQVEKWIEFSYTTKHNLKSAKLFHNTCKVPLCREICSSFSQLRYYLYRAGAVDIWDAIVTADDLSFARKLWVVVDLNYTAIKWNNDIVQKVW